MKPHTTTDMGGVTYPSFSRVKPRNRMVNVRVTEQEFSVLEGIALHEKVTIAAAAYVLLADALSRRLVN